MIGALAGGMGGLGGAAAANPYAAAFGAAASAAAGGPSNATSGGGEGDMIVGAPEWAMPNKNSVLGMNQSTLLMAGALLLVAVVVLKK